MDFASWLFGFACGWLSLCVIEALLARRARRKGERHGTP